METEPNKLIVAEALPIITPPLPGLLFILVAPDVLVLFITTVPPEGDTIATSPPHTVVFEVRLPKFTSEELVIATGSVAKFKDVAGLAPPPPPFAATYETI